MWRFIENPKFYPILVALIIVSITGSCAKRQLLLNPPGVRAPAGGFENPSPKGDTFGKSEPDIREGQITPQVPDSLALDSSKESNLGLGGGIGNKDVSSPVKITENTLAESEFLGTGGPLSGDGSRSGGLGNFDSGVIGKRQSGLGSSFESGGGSQGRGSQDENFQGGGGSQDENFQGGGGSQGESFSPHDFLGEDSNVTDGGLDVAKRGSFKETDELGDIHFNFDQSDLDDIAKEILNKNADWMKANPDIKVEIEGHCDERGTNNYNLGLGERRALSAKKYLTALGISKDRLVTISYGEERPFCMESNLNCWYENRRGHFLVSK